MTLFSCLRPKPFAMAILTATLFAGPSYAQVTIPSDARSFFALEIFDTPPKYSSDYPHFDYVNPDAPSGGDLVLGQVGTFDSLNYHIVKGTPAVGTSNLNDGLLTVNLDEGLISYYPLIAQDIYEAPDRSWLIITMREDATFHDGHPITAEDVVFTHETLRAYAAPRYRDRFYNDVASVTALDDVTVEFKVRPDSDNRRVLRQIATFGIMPKHYWQDRTFDETSLEPPLGSAPYRISAVDPGKSITYELVDDYWGADHPAVKGTLAFATIRYDYYRDANIMTEAFKGGQIDYMPISSSQEWTTGFEGLPAVDDGRLKLEAIPSQEPKNWLGLMMNLRRGIFQDPRVREAMQYFYDFETARRTVHYGLYSRTMSYFPNSDMAASGLPSAEERAALEPYRGQIDDRVFTDPITLPTTKGDGNFRHNLRTALALMKRAGWEVQDGVMTHNETGEVFTFEILYRSPVMEKVIAPLVANFARAGITVTPRIADPSAFIRRLDVFDYDMILLGLLQFYPPTAALRGLWGSAGVHEVGAENFSGLNDPVADALIENIVGATDWPSIRTATRALDRYLHWQFISIPMYFDDSYRVGYWDIFARPQTRPKLDLGFSTWWHSSHNPAASRAAR
ncbi:MAG: extracellular solute-binding protein [Pseudomonadota bacterium]